MADLPTYKTETFEGPLDLLLTLVEKNKMEIADIQIAVIFEQYMDYLDDMKKMDMEIAGEFIVMATELMLIKSKMLLPKEEKTEEEDPRTRLAAQLLEYKKAKEAAKTLETMYVRYSARYVKDTDEIPADNTTLAPQDRILLEKAFLRLFSKKDKEAPAPLGELTPMIEKAVVSVSDKIKTVVASLRIGGVMPFPALFDTVSTRSEAVAVFLALLSLIKDGYILLEKRFEADENAENDNAGEAFGYTFFCTLNPELTVPEDYSGISDI